MRKIWFVSENYWPENNTTAFLITKMADSVANQCPVGVIAFGEVQEKRHPNINMVRVKNIGFFDKRKLVQRFCKQFLQSLRLCIKLIQHVKKGDKVVVVTSPAFILIFTAFIKRWRKIHLTILVHDIFPDNLLVIGATSTRRLSYRVLQRLFTFSYRQADLLITIGRDMQKYVRLKVNDHEKVLYIPNFAETDTLIPSPKEQNPILKQLGIQNKFILLFTGNIGRMQNVDFLLETIANLQDEKDIHFVFIGAGACISKMEQFIDQNKLENISLLPSMDRSRANDFLNAGDVGIVSLLPHSQGCGVPSKTYTYLAVGKPILAIMDDDSEIAMVVKESDCGWVAEPNDGQALKQLILYLKANPEEIVSKSRKALRVSSEVYSEKLITARLTDVFCENIFDQTVSVVNEL